jgi:hypothetical protein
MWLLTCFSEDVSALWARDGLSRRGLDPFEVLTQDSLAYEVGWIHRLEPGRVSTDMTLASGRRVRDGEVRGVLNRLSIVFPSSLKLIHPSDRYYVTNELQAFLLSWLHGLAAPVLNRPTPLGLSGRLRHVSEWIWLASRAGLPNPGYRQSSNDTPLQWDVSVRLVPDSTPVTTVIVVGQILTGQAVPPYISAGCLRLSRLAGAQLLGIDFVVNTRNDWTLAGVSTTPDLSLGGEPLLDALASALCNNSQEIK